MGPGFTLEGELALGQATGCQTPMPTTAHIPHSLLVFPENKLVTAADSRWHRLDGQAAGDRRGQQRQQGEGGGLCSHKINRPKEEEALSACYPHPTPHSTWYLSQGKERWLASQKDSVTWEHLPGYTQRGAVFNLCEEIGTAAPDPHPTQWVRLLGQA